jgi:polysaccharide deacetylase family protein (PEP-CTERM system associated)
MAQAEIVNILSVDIEDYFQVEGFSGSISMEEWDRYEVRFQFGLEWLLQILDSARLQATFFILGWIAERYPQWIAEIARKGHEIGIHGYGHRRVDSLTPADFQADIERTLAVLKSLGIQDIRGHRAPSFSITPATHWAWDVIEECGLTYDASLSVLYFPNHSQPWTQPNPGPQILRTAQGRPLRLFPQAYLPHWGHWPFAGGGFFRLYPYWVTHWGIKKWNERGVPVTVYVHPWEFDPDQPRLDAPYIKHLKHYVNLEINREKFARLLQDFRFCPCRDKL